MHQTDSLSVALKHTVSRIMKIVQANIVTTCLIYQDVNILSYSYRTLNLETTEKYDFQKAEHIRDAEII